MPQKLPVIFIIDLDNTMIGMTDFALNRWELHDILQDPMHDYYFGKSSIDTSKRAFVASLHPSMIRPGLKDALHKLKVMFPTAEVFVYSAGMHVYVNTIVNWLEKELQFEFHKPILTRNNVFYVENAARKSIRREFPNIAQHLAAKYPALTNIQVQEQVIKNRLIFIDDSDVIYDYKEKWLQCPSYDYKHVLDIAEGIPLDVLRKDHVRTYLQKNSWFAEPLDVTEDERNMMYHVFMAQQYQKHIDHNRKALQDIFWPTFVRAASKYKDHVNPFTAKTVKKIQECINKITI